MGSSIFRPLAAAAAAAWAMARWRVLVDVPNERSSHRAPTPRGGGIGIVLAAAAGTAWLAVSGAAPLPGAMAFTGFAAGCLICAVAGLADDARRLSFAVKLVTQCAAAAIAMAAGVVIETIYVPGFGSLTLGVASYGLTLLWLVGLTNAFNFMDGLDGLAGGTAVLAAAFLALAAFELGQPAATGLALVLAATSLGFLVVNFPPARIFMGDVGSQFLGFAFAGLGVLLGRGDDTGTLVLLVPLLLFHFIFDTTLTWFRRLRRRERLTAAHRSHLYQILNRSGWSHRQVSLLTYAMTAVQGVMALWYVGADPVDRPAVFLIALAIQAVYAWAALRRPAA